jgi:hypothetical protein
MTAMPGNTHDGTHMKQTHGQVKGGITEGSSMIFDARANQKDTLDTIAGRQQPLRDETWTSGKRRQGLYRILAVHTERSG